MNTEQIRDLADVAADKLTRLAEDMEAGPGALHAYRDETLAEDRNNAAGALERLRNVLQTTPALWSDAETQAADLRADRLANRPDLVRRNAAAWRAVADA